MQKSARSPTTSPGCIEPHPHHGSLEKGWLHATLFCFRGSPPMKSLGIRSRILLAALAPAALVAFLVSGMLVAEQMKQTRIDQHRRIAAVARQLSTAAEYNLFVGNTDGLQRLADGALAEPDVLAVAILDANGRPLVTTIPLQDLPAPEQVFPDFDPLPGTSQMHHWHSTQIRATNYGEYDLFSGTHAPQPPSLGQLLIKVSGASLYTEMRRHTLTAALISVVMLLFGVLLAVALSRGLIRALTDIGRVVEGIGEGHHHLRVVHAGKDELGHLAAGINAMADAVGQTQEALAARIAAATATLRQERDEAAQASLARSRFFAAASHDLRQPVQALGLFAARLEHDAKRSALRPRVEQIAQSVRNLQGLLDTLLDYSRLDGQVYRLDTRPVRASSLIDSIVTEFSASANEKHLHLRQRVADCWLLTDPALLRRILINLLSNALRHTRHGSVLLACRRGATHARIQVWDTGPGIPSEQQEAVFEELVQLDNPERDPGKGLGLGLAIVRRTAALLGHPLTLKSRVGKGSCFSITIPLSSRPTGPEADPEIAFAAEEQVFILGMATPEQEELVSLFDTWDYATRVFSADAEVLAWVASHTAPTLLVCETGGNMQHALQLLDRIDAAAGQSLPALLIHPGPLPAPTQSIRRLVLSRPFRPARLRAIVAHLFTLLP
jgi:signal transduction histidine kinase